MVAEERVAPRSCRRRPPATYRSRSISRTDARRCTSCRLRSASRSTIAAVATAAGLDASDLIADLPVVAVSAGIAHLMVPVRDEAALRSAERDPEHAPRVCGGRCRVALPLHGARRRRRHGAHVRSVPGDRGGSGDGFAAGLLGAYLSHGLAGMPGRAVVAQGEMIGRPSFLHVQVRADGDSWAIEVEARYDRRARGLFLLSVAQPWQATAGCSTTVSPSAASTSV